MRTTKKLNLVVPLLKPKTPPPNLRHLSGEPNHPSPPSSPAPSSPTTQLQNPNNNVTKSAVNPQLLHLFRSSSSSSSNPTAPLHSASSSAAALKFLHILHSNSLPLQNPSSLSSTFQALFELAAHDHPKKQENTTNLYDLFAMSKELNIPLTLHSAILLVRSFGRAGMVDESFVVYKYLDPELRNTDLANVILLVVLKSNRFEDALKLLDEMFEPDSKFPPNVATSEIVFWGLLLLKWENENVEKIVELVSRFGEGGMLPKVVWLNQLIGKLCKKGHVNTAWDVVQKVMELGGVVGVSSCNSLLTGLNRLRHFKRMNMLLQDMKDNDILPDIVTFGIVIDHLCKFRRVDEALDVFKKMSDGTDGFVAKPNVVVYNTLISGLCKVGRQEEGLDLMKQMSLKHDCKPNTVTFNSLIGGFCKFGEIERANELFVQMTEEGVQPDVITINSLVEGLCKHEKPDKALEFFNDMKGKSVKVNVVTYRILIAAFCNNTNSIGNAMHLFDEMLETGCLPDQTVYYTLISGLTKAEKLDEASFVASKMKESGFQLDIVCYNVLIGGFCKRKRLDKIYALLKDMEKAGIKPDGITYDTLISYFCENGDLKTADSVMKKMVKDGIIPTVITYGSLIHAYCLAGNIDEALKLFTEMGSASKFPANIVIYNTLIDSLCRTNNVDAALSLMDDMKFKGVKPNTTTFNAMLKGLHDNNLLDKALKFLDQMTEQGCNPDYITMEILTNWLSVVGETERLKCFLRE